MRKLSGVLLVLFLLCGGSTFLKAQDEGKANDPPKVLVILRETLKPGKDGASHLKTESAFVQAVTASKQPIHYLGMDSISGTTRSLYFEGYSSFGEWEQENQRMQADAVLSAAMDRASAADGELLSDSSTGVFRYLEEYSRPTSKELGKMRYMDITTFHIRPGHQKEWFDLAKLYQDLYQKSATDASWAMYEMMYGAQSGIYLIITPLQSIGEIDHQIASDGELMKGLGEEEKAKLRALSAAAIESEQSNLYKFNPKTSVPNDLFIKQDPTFWRSRDMGMKQTAKAVKQDTPPSQ